MQLRETYVTTIRNTVPPWAVKPLTTLVDALVVVWALALIYTLLLVQGLGPAAATTGGRPLTRIEQWLLAPWLGLGVTALLCLLLALGWFARGWAAEGATEAGVV